MSPEAVKRKGWMIYLADEAGGWWPAWECAGETRAEAIDNYARLYCGGDSWDRIEYDKRRRAKIVKCVRVRVEPVTP